jgi:hypothetical protein
MRLAATARCARPASDWAAIADYQNIVQAALAVISIPRRRRRAGQAGTPLTGRDCGRGQRSHRLDNLIDFNRVDDPCGEVLLRTRFDEDDLATIRSQLLMLRK